MKCFFYFTNKFKSKQPKSELELKNQNNSDASSASRTTKSTGSLTSPGSISELRREKGQGLRVFCLSELRTATNDFRCMIGGGAFGSVFKGTIMPADGQGERTEVAVKMFNQLSSHGHKEWLTEVQFLAVVSHPNLVKLLGYCSEDGERKIHRLLVYEYMPNASLDNHLFSRKLPTLPWKKRLHIILGAAEGLAYLHEGLEIQVIHRDFKPSNVLLDENFNPKISDFGLAREGPTGDRTHVSTAAVGTHGYAAPEYVQIGHLSVKSDIWSFGVVLFEILTGRRALERNGPESEQRLLDWVKQFLADGKKFSMIIDPRLTDHYSLVAARRVARLATSCLNKNPKDRPTMREVVESLKQALQESEDWEPGPLT